MKYPATPILAVLLWACGTDPRDVTRPPVEPVPRGGEAFNPVDQLIQRLPYVPLPWTFELWGDGVPSIELSPIEQQLLANDPEQEAGVAVGLVGDHPDARHILWLSVADSELPMITTFSSDGEFVRSEGLVIGQCGPGPCYECKETVRINEDFTILTTDTVTACECDPTYEPLAIPCEHYVTVLQGTLGSRGAFMTAPMVIDLNK